MANRSGTAYQRNLDELFADSDSELSDFEGFVKAWISKLAINDQVYADSQLDDDKWKDEDQDDDPITFAFNRTPRLRVSAPDNADDLAIFELFFHCRTSSLWPRPIVVLRPKPSA